VPAAAIEPSLAGGVTQYFRSSGVRWRNSYVRSRILDTVLRWTCSRNCPKVMTIISGKLATPVDEG
jgi:hypothetical protein